MPHQCVKCGEFYPDGSQDLLKGCSCGGRFFFFIKEKDLEDAKKVTVGLSDEDKQQIESDVLEIIGDEIDESKPVVLDLENIRVLKPGQYELDLVGLFHKKPLVYKLEEGKYIVDIAASFSREDK